jgi:hypothetical protein
MTKNEAVYNERLGKAITSLRAIMLLYLFSIPTLKAQTEEMNFEVV